MCTALVLAGCNAATEKEQGEKERTSGSSTYNSFPDDLYLDDQDPLEGSGRGGAEGREDIEASGSGLGPDDEDGRDDREFTSSNRIDTVPNRPAEPKPPYTIDEPSVKTKEQTNLESVNRPDTGVDVIEPSGVDEDSADNGDDIHEVYIMNPKHEDRASSFFAQPGVLAAVIGGDVHRVQDAQKGRGLVRPGRAEKIAGGTGIPEARSAPSQSGVLRLSRRSSREPANSLVPRCQAEKDIVLRPN